MAQWERIHLSMQETGAQSLDEEDPLEKEMTPRSSNLGWEIPWREEVGRRQSVGSQRTIPNLATKQQLLQAR